MEKVEEICRLCLSKEGLMLPIFRKEEPEDGPSFPIKIMSCASIEIFADDELPSKVCHICAHQVEKSFQFQRQCKNSDAFLRDQLKTLKNGDYSNAVTLSIFKLENLEGKNSWSTKLEQVTEEKSERGLDFGATNQDSQEKYNFYIPSCFVCSLTCNSYDNLMDHLMTNHPNLELFLCKECNLHFSSSNDFKMHIIGKHCLTCKQCNQVFKHEKTWLEHESHCNQNHICKFCSKAFDKMYEMKKHELSHLEKMCQFCSKEFQSKEIYRAHIKMCNQSYVCKFCKLHFDMKKDLIEHVISLHDSMYEGSPKTRATIRPNDALQCRICQMNFTDASLLESHMAVEHKELLSCRFCTKVFSLKSSLRRHEKSHSGLKPYQCKYCPRKFKDNSTCIVHTRTHTGEHPFRCQECHKDFKQLANLKMHTYRHHKKTVKNGKKTEVFDPETEKSETLHETNQSFSLFFPNHEIENYSVEPVRDYHHVDMNISGFEQSVTVLQNP